MAKDILKSFTKTSSLLTNKNNNSNVIIFIILRVKARAILCPHQGDNTVFTYFHPY